MENDNQIPPAKGLEVAGVLDAMLFEESSNRVVLAMFERRQWNGEEQLWQLQEKLNAYASFALDGEMQENHPELSGRPVCIQLRTVHSPSDRALSLLEQARRQLALQEIGLEIWKIGETPDSSPPHP